MRPGRATVIQVWEKVGEQILGQNPHVALDMVVENKASGKGRFVVPPPPLALPMGVGQVDGCQRRHGRQLV